MNFINKLWRKRVKLPELPPHSYVEIDRENSIMLRWHCSFCDQDFMVRRDFLKGYPDMHRGQCEAQRPRELVVIRRNI